MLNCKLDVINEILQFKRKKFLLTSKALLAVSSSKGHRLLKSNSSQLMQAGAQFIFM